MTYLLECKDLTHHYKDPLHHQAGIFDVSLTLKKGQRLGLVGESGSGKSTIAKILSRLLDLQEGSIQFLGQSLATYADLEFYKRVQYISQQPQEAFHPKRNLRASLEEVCQNFKICQTKKEMEEKIDQLLERVGLHPELAHQFPHQLSGGECQRMAIARALLVQPDLLICDEITSALDVTVQEGVMDLLQEIQNSSQTSFLFISHDIALVSQFCDEIMVLKDGKIQEKGVMSDVLRNPQSDYTKMLMKPYLEEGREP